ncbi:hypothetical protein A9Q99_16880 [Gammaproteobacteria bacterium 45_16_T64]|nr:hypothetical protein A9Q99_16880 [Gammaproteobacteria bacterium 45_16_T64]
MTNQPLHRFQLIGTESSLFTGKVRGYLRYKKIPFTEQISSLQVYRKVIVPRTGKQMIPVLLTPDDECIQDTTCIIDHLEKDYPEHSVYPETPKQRLASILLECYGDEWLVMPAMHYRWQFKRYNLPFILKEFGQTAMPQLPGPLQYVIGSIPAFAFGGRYKPYFGVTKNMESAIESSYESLLADLETHFSQYPYLLGNRPSIGDYGFLGPFYAHLYRDPYPKKLMQQKAPNVLKWVERMQFSTDARYGDFLDNDEIPETLLPILQRMTREQFPVLEDTGIRLDKWTLTHPEKRQIKRIIGSHTFSIEGESSTRAVTPFSYWMFQRALKIYNDATTEKNNLDGFLKDIQGESAFLNQSKTVLEYTKYRLNVA